MPKLPRKVKKALAGKYSQYRFRAGRTNENVSDDDSFYNDNASVASNVSDFSNYRDEDDDCGIEELGSYDLFEEKLKEAIDLATQKSANIRVSALDGLFKAFTKKFVPDFVEDRHVTLSDIIERSIKKGKMLEQIAAANLSCLLITQLGPSQSGEDAYNILKPLFQTTVNDASLSLKARSAIANAYGFCCFIAESDINEFMIVMNTLEKIFSASYGREKPETNTDLIAFHTACLSSWTLLMTLVPSPHACKMLESHMEHLGSLLDSTDVDLRITAGEAIAILFENAVEHDEDEAYDSVEELIPKLKALATDSAKHRSKKDRKEQRSSFRDIVKFIEDGINYHEKISINTRETLEINNWYTKKHYDGICKGICSGVNLHLTENELIRDVFELGAPLKALSETDSNRPSKYQRQLVNNQAFKLRTLTRGKERNKRNAFH